MKFWYQLTEWQEDVRLLKGCMENLVKYGAKFQIKRDGAGNLAIFTEGKQLDVDFANAIRANMDNGMEGRITVCGVFDGKEWTLTPEGV